MDIRDVLLFLPAPEGAPAALAAAADLAAGAGASLRALCRVEEPPTPIADSFVIGPEGVGDAIAHRDHAIAAAALPVREAFTAACAARGLAGAFDLAPAGAALEEIAIAARSCDLAVLPRPGSHQTAARRLAELVLLGSGAPGLVVPDAAPEDRSGPAAFNHVALAWDGSREARRALGEGMPFLKAAGRVSLLIADGEADPAPVRVLLARHGIDARFEAIESVDGGPGRALLLACSVLGAELLVMGAYGRSRAAELLLGGATRTILGQAQIPVLLAH